jgi:hypothetical protein
MEQAKGVKRVTSEVVKSDEIVEAVKEVEVLKAVNELNINEILETMKAQQARIDELERRTLPKEMITVNTKAPIYRLGMIDGKIISNITNNKRTQIDDTGKAHVIQEFAVSYFGVDQPQRMSMTTFRELLTRIETTFVRTIPSTSKFDKETGKPLIDSYELQYEGQNYIVKENVINI